MLCTHSLEMWVHDVVVIRVIILDIDVVQAWLVHTALQIPDHALALCHVVAYMHTLKRPRLRWYFYTFKEPRN